MLTSCGRNFIGLRFFWQQGIEQEHAGSGDYGGVGDVEVGPMVGEDVDFNEVDDRAVEEAVVDVAEGAAQDERKCYGDQSDVVTEPDQKGEDDECGKECKADQRPMDQVGRCGVCEEREGGAFVGPVGDAEDAGDDRNVAA